MYKGAITPSLRQVSLYKWLPVQCNSFKCCKGGQRLCSAHTHTHPHTSHISFTCYYKAKAFSLLFHWTNDTNKAQLSSSRLGMNGSQMNQGDEWLFWQAATKKKPHSVLKHGWKQTGLDHMQLRKLLISSEKFHHVIQETFLFFFFFFF